MRNVKDDIIPKIVFVTSLYLMFVPLLSNQIYADENDSFDVKIMTQYLNLVWMKSDRKCFTIDYYKTSWIVLVQ